MAGNHLGMIYAVDIMGAKCFGRIWLLVSWASFFATAALPLAFFVKRLQF